MVGKKITALVASFQPSTPQPRRRGIWKLGRDYYYPVEGKGYMEVGFQSSLEVFNPAQAAGERWWLSLAGFSEGSPQHVLNLSEEGGWGDVLGREWKALGRMSEAGIRSPVAERSQGKLLNLTT